MTGFPTELHRLYNEDKDLFHKQFYALVLSVSAMIAPRYPPKTYNNNQRWSEEEYRALAQDVYFKQLLPEYRCLGYKSNRVDHDSCQNR